MTEKELEVVSAFRQLHQGEGGAVVFADQLYELGFLQKIQNDEQVTLYNYAIHMIEKMGAMTPGQKYQLCLTIAKYLQGVIVEGDS